MKVNRPQTHRELSQNLISHMGKSVIGKHVIWLQKERHGIKNVLVKALMFGEAALAALSLIGLPLIGQGFSSYQRVKNYKRLGLSEAKINPPPKAPIHLKTPTQGFNHVDEFILHEKTIWVRPRNHPNAEWEMIYFDSQGGKNYPLEIRVDGANLMAVDNDRNIHYKKVLKEKRDDHNYSFTDTSSKDNWKAAWYSFPLLRRFYHLTTPLRLKLPRDTLSWAISHRGKYNRYFEDARGKAHPEFAMVTTVYALTKAGDRLLYADPYLTRGFRHTIDIPGNGFKAKKITASASVIMIEGVKNGKVVRYTRLADFDALGKNPFLEGFYNKNARAATDWKLEPDIELKGKATVDDDDQTIFQNGEGNAARVLRIGGTNDEGRKGYYQKQINDAQWMFIPI